MGSPDHRLSSQKEAFKQKAIAFTIFSAESLKLSPTLKAQIVAKLLQEHLAA
jgi:hypothetical protein